VASETYDFLLSSNCLEHVANPIKALFAWRRVIRTGGFAIVVLPRKDSNFDHRRQDTPLQHLLDDYHNDVGEDDLTHLPEILEKHDLALDPGGGGAAHFHQRSLQNLQNRCLHHHVFSLAVLSQAAEHCGFAVERAETMKRDHWVFLTKTGHQAREGCDRRSHGHRSHSVVFPLDPAPFPCMKGRHGHRNAFH
jgi:SAM-dependent methyltransferase